MRTKFLLATVVFTAIALYSQAMFFGKCKKKHKKHDAIIEVVVEKVKSGYTMAQLIQADSIMEASFTSKQKGLIKRHTAISQDSTQFFATIWWESMADIETAKMAFMQAASAQKRMAMTESIVYNYFKSNKKGKRCDK